MKTTGIGKLRKLKNNQLSRLCKPDIQVVTKSNKISIPVIRIEVKKRVKTTKRKRKGN